MYNTNKPLSSILFA